MSNRFTKKDAIARVKELCNVLGKQYGYNNGNWFLKQVYGGYLIMQMGERGTQSPPFGHDIHSAREIWQLCNFAMRAIQLDRLDGEFSASYWPKNKCDIN